MADRAYIRWTKHGPPLEDQRKAVRPYVERDEWVYADEPPKGRRKHRALEGDPLPERTAILRDLRPGSRLIVSSLDRVGRSVGDIRAVLDALLDTGRSLFDVRVGLAITPETTRKVQSDAALSAEAELKREHVRTARAALRSSKVKVGAKPADLSPEAMKAAERDWREATVSQADLAKRYGRSTNWFRRRWGNREMKPGRKPKTPT